jgi:hypothetical protein
VCTVSLGTRELFLIKVSIKLGGDKGGVTLKMCFQHLNVATPNAPENTCVFSIFEAPDTYTNLQIGLKCHIDDIVDLESHTWRYVSNTVQLVFSMHPVIRESGCSCVGTTSS